MARKPTHYRLTISRPVTAAGLNFNPGAKYMVKAAVHDQIRDQTPDAIASAEPVAME